MRTSASHSHLKKSRHGIWYYRWVVPPSVRVLHPLLPKEIKRSTGTADIRRAGVMARRHHDALLTLLANGQHMSAPDGRFAFRGWTVERDPVTQHITKIEVSPDDTPAGLAVLSDLLKSANVVALPGAPTHVHQAEPVPQVRIWLSEAIEKWCTLQRQSDAWSEETLVYAHAPTLLLFRELICSQQPPWDGPKPQRWDMQLCNLSPKAMEAFLESFWSFPGRQGKRSGATTGPEIVKLGGTPQSRANLFKRLGHIRQFIAYCVSKAWLPEQTLKEVDNVLAKDTMRARRKDAAKKEGRDGNATDGYIAFSEAELAKIFGTALVGQTRLRAGAAERYWIPLISLYSGLRVAEASGLQPGDLELVEGIYCLHVQPHRGPVSTGIKSAGKLITTRMKTPSSKRRVPLHPKLIELGLVDYIKMRQELGAFWLWDLLWTDKDQFGKYPSLNFTNLLKATKVHAERRKVFHSLRSTIIQGLRKAGMQDSQRRSFIGHEGKTTEEKSYARSDDGPAVAMKLAFDFLSQVTFPVNVPAWSELPASQEDFPRRGTGRTFDLATSLTRRE